MTNTVLFKEKQGSCIRTYAIVSDYGGWGIREGLFCKGRAYTV